MKYINRLKFDKQHWNINKLLIVSRRFDRIFQGKNTFKKYANCNLMLFLIRIMNCNKIDIFKLKIINCEQKTIIRFMLFILYRIYV